MLSGAGPMCSLRDDVALQLRIVSTLTPAEVQAYRAEHIQHSKGSGTTAKQLPGLLVPLQLHIELRSNMYTDVIASSSGATVYAPLFAGDGRPVQPIVRTAATKFAVVTLDLRDHVHGGSALMRDAPRVCRPLQLCDVNGCRALPC